LEPRYPLDKVHEVAASGDLVLAESRARRIVLDLIDSYVEAMSFARALLGALRREHFQRTVELDEPPYRGAFDEYVCPLPPDLAARFGLETVGTWYVKLKLFISDDDGCITCVSMHPAERPSVKGRGKR
jgi:hypothetical protein